MTELVRQRTHHDCTICCFAMVTGLAYEAVVNAVGDCFDPRRGFMGISRGAERLGFSSRHENGQAVGEVIWLHRGFEISPDYFRAFAWGRRAIMTVPSLNKESGFHSVYWDGRRLFDPSTRRTYGAFAELKPDDMLLFREAPR